MGDVYRVSVGDWVSFYLDARIVISEVRYIIKNEYACVVTNIRALPLSSILEVRPAKEQPHET